MLQESCQLQFMVQMPLFSRLNSFHFYVGYNFFGSFTRPCVVLFERGYVWPLNGWWMWVFRGFVRRIIHNSSKEFGVVIGHTVVLTAIRTAAILSFYSKVIKRIGRGIIKMGIKPDTDEHASIVVWLD